MRKVIRALAVSVLIFLSISVPGQTTLLEAEQELLSQLLEGGEPSRFLDLELIDLAVKRPEGTFAPCNLSLLKGRSPSNRRNSLTLTPDLEITADDRFETPLAGVT